MSIERITELETRLLFLEQNLNELNDIVFRQSQQIQRLEQANEKLAARVRDLAESSKEKTPVDERPPHY